MSFEWETVSIKIPKSMKAELEAIAKSKVLAPEFDVYNQALHDFIELQAWQTWRIKRGLAARDAGDYASDEEVAAAFAAWRIRGMAEARVRWTRPAMEDLQAAGEYASSRDPQAARRIAEQIQEYTAHPSPLNGAYLQRGRVPGTVELVIDYYAYFVSIKDTDDSIDVVGFLHLQ